TRDSTAGPFSRQLWHSTNGGQTWRNVWSTTFPQGVILDIAFHPSDPTKMWIGMSVGFTNNADQARKMFYSSDAGNTWTNITEGLPAAPIFTIAVPANNSDTAVYVGSAAGAFYRDNKTNKFVEFQGGIPRGVMITDLKIHEGTKKIYAGTYGRGLWRANLYDQPYEGPGVTALINRSGLLNVYPNPSNGVFRIEWDDKQEVNQELSITDLVGKIVYTNKAFSGRANVDLSHLARGIYIVKFANGSEVLTKKITLVR
ncbi:MAG: T9SS type A sorting domain-containing protein, partial [Saprospiraceae bacterium]|nr:T9SS type A sorting domain-containing protein [Saprospiraceae bacterium]